MIFFEGRALLSYALPSWYILLLLCNYLYILLGIFTTILVWRLTTIELPVNVGLIVTLPIARLTIFVGSDSCICIVIFEIFRFVTTTR